MEDTRAARAVHTVLPPARPEAPTGVLSAWEQSRQHMHIWCQPENGPLMWLTRGWRRKLAY